MKKNLMMVYGRTLSQLITDTEDVQKDLEPYYSKLKQGTVGGQLIDLSSTELADIKAEFQDGTDRYKAYNEKLKRMQAPARFMGKQQSLKAAYEAYTAGCQAMTDSLVLETSSVDQAKFDQSETDQNEAMDRIIRLIQSILMANG
ncbi:hypothetical protein ACRYI5_10610 [Furfurilactobacillus sp. WILCCON 0119]|uniref:hypothetical protein n=1 Tax=Furfurilactobacillus entadae TaxID=2922307 RepID=UPI0035E6421A